LGKVTQKLLLEKVTQKLLLEKVTQNLGNKLERNLGNTFRTKPRK
jgi:hypothetical protein